ncbi:hypothetical protein AJ79_07195 [Helicocarpus griseus UAMH5409]|uniref:RGS domain-containing protein n=1 Tax=Helicocarpus griseus UAMH5409 TaxID=1447875 RepID=A0A2B7X575_9EURO|nr:hypothetical protein AJ79_07195 [Helicocarpus griseus UAMH5409]
MIASTSRYSALFFWNLTPDSTPQHSPAPSDCDSDEENAMEGWQPTSRPLSLAIPPSGPRPTLDDVLSNTSPPPYTLSAFMAFLSQNHCLETLEFTMDANRYRENYHADPSRTQHLCMLFQRILSAYIVPAAPREINVSSEVRDALLSHLNSTTPPRPETLDSAIRRMRDLMEESIFIPFLKSQSPPPMPYSAYDETSQDESQMARHASIRRRLSPQSSFVSQRPPAAGYSLQPKTSVARSGSRSSGYAYSPSSGDSGSANLTDDSGSMTSSPDVGEPMTPPTTPPSSDMPLQLGAAGQSPKTRPDNAWKKMGMKLGWKKRTGGPGSRDGRFPATEEE